ncbi:MAG: hypothetical protein KIT11_00010 [Fimbriimonadaceae bacterium]|nr:hypothetical protein [Fimbriimonadaceae bacterium]QYK55241.1 MAG: hypothetical protein KF733_09525 [Fimbriimonadaceae bacterium]
MRHDEDFERNAESFRLRRGAVEHEDRQIESRLASLLIANSFLVTAVVLLLANARNSVDPNAFFVSALVIGLVSVLLAVLTEYGIIGARHAQRLAVDASGPFERIAPFVGPGAEEWRACLHMDASAPFKGSFLAAHWFGKATVLAWAGLVHYCLVRIYGEDLAGAATVALFSVVYGYLFFVYYRHNPRQKLKR